MRKNLTAALATALLAAAVLTIAAGTPAAGAPPRAPADFFGIGPQTPLTDRDAEYMKAGGIGTARLPIAYSSLKPTPSSELNWAGLDEAVTIAAGAGLKILPFLYGTPHWLAKKPTTLPVDNGTQKREWKAFLTAAVERYGPRGRFWAEHPEVRKAPIRTWQIWNEANFFYFALPASPGRYAKLVKISGQAIKAADPGAKVILAGLFAKPTTKGARGMPAARFLKAFYRAKGIKSSFDGISLHPYAINTRILKEYVEEFRKVAVEANDRSVGLYITEMGWGSEPNFKKVAFEQGPQGQVRQLRGAYGYLLSNRARLHLKQVYWFSWKDIQGDCNFCDSVGLFQEGEGFKPKPSWKAFVKISRGRLRP